MKLLNSITVFIIMAFIVTCSNISFAQFGGGNGTQTAPYEIYTIEHLMTLSDSVWRPDLGVPTGSKYNWSRGKYFKLMNDITDSVKFTIGYAMSTYHYEYYFQGDFNGNNKKITLAIDGKLVFFPVNNAWFNITYDGIGLFSAIYEAKIYDLTVDGYVKGASFVGGISGNAEKSNVSNCINYCDITGVEWYNGTSEIGGICGNATSTNVIRCTNHGTIYSAYYNDYFGMKCANIGGICGLVSGTVSVINCTNYGNVSAIYGNVGGILGRFMGTYYLKNCANYGNVAGNMYIGGIVGIIACIEFSNCHNYGNIIGEHAVGGITGCIVNLTSGYEVPESEIPPCVISHCTNSGTITATSAAGGIAGHTHDQTEILHCINIGTVRGDSVVGGIASGYDNQFADHNGTINNCHNAGLVIGKDIVGGIQGRCWGEIRNSLNTGVVIGNANTGGIAGETNETAVIQNCHYDKQMCIHGGIVGQDIAGQAEGYLTKELIGSNLEAKLSNTDWTFSSLNLYPTLSYFIQDTIALVAISPIYLYNETDDFDRQNKVRTDFKVNLENDVKWNRIIGNVDIVNDDGLVKSNGNDTLICSIGDYKRLIPINIQLQPIGDVKFSFFATEHRQVSPTATNYNIPIYVKANAKTLQEIAIKKLTIEIDKSIFYLKQVDNNVTANSNGNLITVENVEIPALNAGEEVVLFNIIGDMLLGNIDSSEIIINPNVEFAEELNTEPELKNGHITLNICREGSNRLIEIAGNSPSIIIKNNPAYDILEVECNVLESGKYSLKVVDMTGRSVKVEEFVASKTGVFQFEIDVAGFGVGRYLLVMGAPNGERFVEKMVKR